MKAEDFKKAIKFSKLCNEGRYEEAKKYSDLRFANLSFADLRDANLSGANLSGANLKGARVLIGNVFKVIR